ncbi:MAG: glycoside hydrolase family 2 TIM barrel-domain containing protein, partial [Candidatus Ornithomonoglobus sp.]
NLKYDFESAKTAVKKASDAGVRYETAVEADVYSAENIAAPVGLTQVNTPEVTYISASYNAEDMRFWSTDDPYLYTVYTILKDSSGNVVDVQKKDTGFRKITYDANSGILINDKAVWLAGYAQRSTNEWAVIGVATDWLQDYDMALLKENNSNFIRWMHVAPKPNEVRSSDRYGVAVVCPAGDKEGVGLDGRNWSQRAEAMRDVMIYFRNSPSVVFWETGNSAVGSAANANDMARLRDRIDPHGMRFIGARSTTAADQMNYDYNYAGTMYGNYAESAITAMKANGIMGPIMETEYARGESPRRVWDLYSPPDFDYVNKLVYKDGATGNKLDGYDVWNATQEEMTVSNVADYNGYYANRAGYGKSLYSAAAMMVWSDSNMHTRNTATENCRTSGRVDPVRQKKEMFEGTKAAQSGESAIHIVGHWSYPQVSGDTYNYFGTENIAIDDRYSYDRYVLNDKRKRDPLNKTVYVIGSADVAKVELYRVDGETETLLGTDSSASSPFIYQFDNIDVTQG